MPEIEVFEEGTITIDGQPVEQQDEESMPKVADPPTEANGEPKAPKRQRTVREPKAEAPADPPPQVEERPAEPTKAPKPALNPEMEPAPKARMVKFADMELDAGTQMRPMLDQRTIERYRRGYLQGDPFPPIRIVRVGEQLVLVDGFQRRAAAEAAGLDALPAVVRKGTLDDAIKEALRANAHHGLQRNAETIRNCVFAAMDRGYHEGSIKALASIVDISWDAAKNFAEKYYEAHPDKAPKLDAEGGRVVKVKRGNQEYTQRTGRIGKNRPSSAAEKTTPADESTPHANGAPAKEREPGEDDMTRAERERESFLKTIPFRDLLAEQSGNTTKFVEIFEEDALFWKSLKDLLPKIEEALATAAGSKAKPGPLRKAAREFVEKFAGPFGAEMCMVCTNGKNSAGGPCTDCGGARYIIPREKRRKK